MEKPFAKSKACAAKCLYAALQALKANGGSLMASEIYPAVEKFVSFTDWEKERAGKMQYIRWHTNLQFYSIDYAVAGFIVKKNGRWYLTPEGETALKGGAESMMMIANEKYHLWNRARKEAGVEDLSPDDGSSGDEEKMEKNILSNLEELEERARLGIKESIRAKGPYEFQDMVAAVLRAMGYHTPFIAPRGKDGGIDIVAYLDPLGARQPRIKVQVKHYPDSPIGVKDIRALKGVLKDDLGIFVTSGTFSPDAKREAMSSDIRALDGEDFINLWTEYYDKMNDADKNMLPLKKISFVGTVE